MMNDKPENVSTKNSFSVRILLTGSIPYWNNVAAELLIRSGYSCDILHSNQWGKLIAWFFTGKLFRYDIVYQVFAVNNWAVSLLMVILGKPFITHWLGSDILSFSSGKASKGWRRMITHCIAMKRTKLHLADSNYLINELLSAEIQASVVTLLPKTIEADPIPLPQKFSTLSYWPDHRESFYRGHWTFQLAEEFPDIEFNIAKATKSNIPTPPNVKFLGEQKNMEDIYANTSVFIRLPEHDSISALVLEALARGRYVIYNKELPGCHFARDYNEAKNALVEIMNLHQPNIKGAQFVSEKFSPAGEAKKISELLQTLLTSEEFTVQNPQSSDS